MSEDAGSSDSTEPPSYPFTGSVVKMNTEDFFSFKPIPEGMEPIVDPETRMCIGYTEMGISIGYDPTFGFFKYGFIYDINEKVVDQYENKLTAEDVDAMSSEELEEYNKFRHAVFDDEDHGMFGSTDSVWLMVATDGALEGAPHVMRYARAMGKRKFSFAERKFAKRAPEPYQRGRKILKERRRRIKVAGLEGRVSKEPTKIEISKAVLAAPITFTLKSTLKMGLSATKLKFEDTALGHNIKSGRYIPEIILEHIIRNGKRLPDSANRAFGLMYKTYVGIAYKNGKARLIEVIVNERTWTIKHFQYSDFNRIGSLSKGKWSGKINQWMEEYEKNTIIKKSFIEDKSIKRIGREKRAQIPQSLVKKLKNRDIKQFKREVEETKKIPYDSEGYPEWHWNKGE